MNAPPSAIFLKQLLPDGDASPPNESDADARYRKLARQFAKVMAISDGYQSNVLEMADRLRRSNEELQKAHVTLRQSEQRFRTLTENLPAGVILVGLDGEVLAANPRMKAWFPEIESDCAAFRRRLATEPIRSLLASTRDDGKTRTAELEAAIQGSTRILRIVASAVKNDDGEVEALLNLIEDITEQKRIEQERQEHEVRERHHRKTESLHRVAGAVAHHFNNQLHAVMGRLELVLRTSSVNDTARQYLNDALESARTAAEISVLMRRYAGEGMFSPRSLDLTEICGQRLERLKQALPDHCRLSAEFPDAGGPSIQGNSDDIAQILTNLVTNAWEACESADAGRIQVRVETVDSKSIPVSRCVPFGWHPAASTYACLSVADNGQGITSEQSEMLFEPFYSTKFTGRGLGLALVAGMVRGHDGAIAVESTPGRGSTFRCYFPLTVPAD